MTVQTPDIQAVLERLKNLENENRRMRQAALALALAFLGVIGAVFMRGRARPGGTIEAERLMMRDKQGRLRVEIAMSYETDPNGYPVILLDG